MISNSKYNLEGKNALITGGAGLLGTQHGIGLVEVGAKAVLADLNFERTQELAQKLNNEFGKNSFYPLHLDVTDKSSIEKARDHLNQQNISIDILVNNAAIDPKVKEGEGLVEKSRFENFELSNWNFQISVGLTGAFLCSQVFGEEMAKRGSGVILNISSDLSVIAPDQRIYRKEGIEDSAQPVKPVTYSVIKSALVGMTKYLAAYWANQGIRVNAISPGGVFNNQPKEFVEKLTNLIPMERMASVDEYKSTIQYLCSEASSYMTGQNIVLDGGRSII